MIITKKKSLKIHHEKANKNTPPKLKKYIRTGCLNKKAVMKILNFNKITIW